MILSEISDSVIEFEKLLYATKIIGEPVLCSLKKLPSGLEFENLVYEWVCKSAVGTNFEGNITQTSDRDFPDIVAKKIYGIEVKLTKGDKWTSIGNSIVETNRIESVEHIYIMFGKLDGKAEIRYKSYDKCICGVAVTHSPRYKIDMNVCTTFFDELGVNYNDFRSNNKKIDIVKNFYRKNSEHLWWIDQDRGVDIIMKEFGKLKKEEKKSILIQAFVTYPEVFNSDYSGVNAMLTNMGITCNNTRDIFSAGGKRIINGITVSAVLGKFHDNLDSVKPKIENINNWTDKVSDTVNKDILLKWLNNL